ncbi:MAG: hypothetical protein M1818_002469 [Claussenomyces sp. TS43310]|nr:MAG: hypothetical protein M1818_002469 [Claussenomyces sp. TS43310]
MNISLNSQRLQRRINQIRVENADSKKFVPERELHDVMSREVVAEVVAEFIPSYHSEEVVDFIVHGARKVFGVLILINNIGHINHFIRNDQLQTRHIDYLLPFTKARLQEILDDEYVTDLFYEKQWEFSVPVFSGRIMPRALARQTILPYLSESYVAVGGYGSVRKICIHPSHRPQGFGDATEFVKKELEFDDTTYENEVRVLSSLQRLKHPNILQLVGCYTYNSKHNLVSPFVPGGTLRRFLENPKSPDLCREEMFSSIAGLTSAIWALHEFVHGDTEPSHKGHHQDLWPDNILVDGARFILADFGLSSIKSMNDVSRTPFKGRRGYCQAPECADLRPPYQEHETTRATDIFALACIIADLLVYLVWGSSGVQEFREAREFRMPPMCYYMYHKGETSNDAVAAWLEKAAKEDGSQSMQEVVQLLGQMLRILPTERPGAATVTATLYICTVRAFWEQFSEMFARFPSSPDALIEKARFLSWLGCQDIELYSSSLGATATLKAFESTVDILRQMREALRSIDETSVNLDCRSFLEVRTLNTQLLNLLSSDLRSTSRSRLESILLANIEAGRSGDIDSTMRTVFGDSLITRKAETKHLVAQVEGAKMASKIAAFQTVSGPIRDKIEIGRYKVAKIRPNQNGGRTRLMFVETIQYQDGFRKKKLLPRVLALCDLLSTKSLSSQLRIPPFYGIYDDIGAFCFEMLYDIPPEHGGEPSRKAPTSLHELLVEGEKCNFPPMERRLRLGLELAEALAAFHDVDWFHKDLTSFNILFFPEIQCLPSDRSNHPYLVGFHHSRSASDDFTEGPLQDRQHQRYHHPKYVSAENHDFTRFRPQFDYYSLGILLLEVGFWATIGVIMDAYAGDDNYTFADVLIQQKLPALSFHMGSQYADLVRQCLSSLDQPSHDIDQKDTLSSTINLAFKEKVVIPLKKLHKLYPLPDTDRKRKIREDDEESDRLPAKQKFE